MRSGSKLLYGYILYFKKSSINNGESSVKYVFSTNSVLDSYCSFTTVINKTLLFIKLYEKSIIVKLDNSKLTEK